MKGMTTCKVCGRDFPLMAEEHYIAQDPQRVGVLANLANTDKATEYDVFDCPHCGCQNVMQVRKSIWFPEVCECDEQKEETEEDQQSHDGCFGCIHVDVPNNEEPCCMCKGNYSDHYEREG